MDLSALFAQEPQAAVPAPAEDTAYKTGIEKKLQEAAAAEANATRAYKTMQENIAKAGRLRSEIVKGLQAGERFEDLLLKAVECIAAMTGDRAFYTSCQAEIERRQQ